MNQESTIREKSRIVPTLSWLLKVKEEEKRVSYKDRFSVKYENMCENTPHVTNLHLRI